MYKYIAMLLVSGSLLADFTWNAEQYHLHSQSQQQAAFEILKETHFSGDESILDIGCGDGKITKELAKLVPKGAVLGVDLSEEQISFAKGYEDDVLFFQVGNIEKLPFIQSFHVITAFTCMQWVCNQKEALEAIYRSLKQGGKFFITMPTGITWELTEAVRIVINKKEWKQYPFQDKQQFFSKEVYASLMRDAGFTIDSFKIIPSPNVFPDRVAFTNFVKQWLPFVQDVPLELRDKFMEEVVDNYLKLQPAQVSGEVFFDKYVYHIIASKPLEN